LIWFEVNGRNSGENFMVTAQRKRSVFRVAMLLIWMAVVALPAPAIAAERVFAPGGVPVVSGGVGEDSVARLKARENEFNLKLVLTLVEGNYLADVGVTIANAAGKTVVQHVTEGPIFMARLPAGTYQVAARYGGIQQARKVVVRAGRLHTEYLRWPANPRVDFPGPGDGRPEERARTPAAVATDAAPRQDATRAAIEFMSGGIGEGSQAAILAREKEFNLKIVFTLVEGNYVAGVSVVVRDASGRTVISHVTDGPFFLARLPEGSYSVTAAYEGQSEGRKVTVVGGRLRTEFMRWKSDPRADTVLPPER
jgi:hypothetical protein